MTIWNGLWKVGFATLLLLSPLASADLMIYHHHNGGLMSVQVYQNGKQASMADVAVFDSTGDILKHGATNSHGWAKLGHVDRNQSIKIEVETADGSTAVKHAYLSSLRQYGSGRRNE